MSSRRLLLLLEHIDDEGPFKTATRGGRWSLRMQMAAETANEAYRFRASYHAAHSTDDNDVRFDPPEFIDPVIAEARAELEKVEAEIAAQTQPELEDAGW